MVKLTKKIMVIVAAIFTLQSFCYASNNTQYQSLDSIRQHVEHYVTKKLRINPGERLQVKVKHLDPRLHLPLCKGKLQSYFPPSQSSTYSHVIGLRCVSEKPWNIYVPVDIKILTQVVIAKQNLPRNVIISEEDVDIAEYDRNRLRKGYFTRLEQVIAKTTKRYLPAGKVIAPSSVQAPQVVHRGDIVLISITSGNLRIQTRGIAKSNGGRGDFIHVQNASSKRIIQAIVTSAGKVEVPV